MRVGISLMLYHKLLGLFHSLAEFGLCLEFLKAGVGISQQTAVLFFNESFNSDEYAS